MPERTTADARIGANVRAARVFRGVTVEALAGLIGKSKSWVSKVENGHLALDSRSAIREIAEALEVSATDLLGESSPTIRPRDRAHGDVVRLRDVLLDSSLDDPPDVPARQLDALVDLVRADIAQQFRAADFAALTTVLPGVVAELQVHTAQGDEQHRRTALLALIDACTPATLTLRHLGQVDLAWVAADRAGRAARLLDDPVAIGAAAFTAAHSRPAAAMSRALRESGRVADRMEGHLGQDRRAHQVYGMLRLSSALACQIDRDHDGATERADEAERVAKRLGEDAGAWQSFGPANVGVWRATLAVEADLPEQALAVAGDVDAAALGSRVRRAVLAIEQGRALAKLGDDGAAVAALRRAEKQSPVRVHGDPMVRDLVAHLHDRAPGRDLRGLAWRMGLI